MRSWAQLIYDQNLLILKIIFVYNNVKLSFLRVVGNNYLLFLV